MADLQKLVLLRNDPELVAEFEMDAEKGDVEAQYGLGLIYAEGRGTAPDQAMSFYWLSRAVEQGDQDAILLRRIVSAQMNDADCAKADELLAAYHNRIAQVIDFSQASRRRGRK